MNYDEMLLIVENILNSNEVNKDTESISLLSVLNLLKKNYNNFEEFEKYIEKCIYSRVKNNYGYSASFIIGNFDYEYNELPAAFKTHSTGDYKDIIFSKRKSEDNYINNTNKSDDLYIKKSDHYEDMNLIVLLADLLSSYYDKCIEYKSKKTSEVNFIKTNNTNFRVSIKYNAVELYFKGLGSVSSVDYSFITNDYRYYINSSNIINILKDKEDVFFSKIYVRINDCPNWMQDKLRTIRYEEIKILEKNEKKLELKRKIFPWIK